MECQACLTANPEQARFCLNCGAQLASSETAQREERKVVTVLFADMVGFTARSEQLDPEDVEQLLRPYHERLRSDLERYSGTVEKFIGDAVMAVFGAPTAHEDDAERAVRAALAIRDWARAQSDLELRIAVNTGEALVNLDARPERGQAMVKGDVVNTAARLQAAAPVNGVLVGRATYQATRLAIEYRPVEPIAARGKSEPVPAWEALELRSRFGVDVRQVSRAPLVGRQRELDALTDTVERVLSAAQAQLVTIVAVPGMGKSRLTWELFRNLDARQQIFVWRQGRSLPYGEGVSFWALGEIVKAQAGILESDSAEVAGDKLSANVTATLGDSPQREWVISHLRPLVGLERRIETGREEQGESFAAWRRYLEAIAAQHPLVLVFEDLHWADEGLLDFIDHLAEWASGVPLLILATARPELLARRPGWGGGKSNALTLSLTALSDAETARLVHELFEKTVLPAELPQLLLERAGGNPLYAEEFVRLVGEGRSGDIPEGVHAIITARLDTLPADDKRLLQHAAVLGKVFWLGALADVAGRSRWAVEETLHSLERREFIRREQKSSVASETEYAFRHALVRDAAYDQLPRGERAEHHRRAARWLESLGRPEDTADMLAHHYALALEYARAAGQSVDDLAERARGALTVAGGRAMALNAFGNAARFYASALELTGAADADRPLLMLGYATALTRTDSASARQALSEASRQLAEQGDHERAAEAEVLLAQVEWHSGNGPATQEHLGRAEAFANNASTSPTRARVLAELSRYHMLTNRAAQAVALGRQAIALAREWGLREVEASALTSVGTARAFSGDKAGMADIERSLDIALAIDSPEASRGYNNLAATVGTLGNLKRSDELRRLAVESGRSYGAAVIARFAEGAVIQGLYQFGRWDDFLAQAELFALDSDRLGRSYQQIYHIVVRGVIETARGQDDAGLEAARKAVEWARDIGEPQVLVPSLAGLAYASFELGFRESAHQALNELRERSPQHMLFDWLLAAATAAPDADSRRLVAASSRRNTDSLLERALSDMVAGNFVEAADALAEAGWITYAAMARSRAAQELAAAGRQAEAAAQLNMALPFWRDVRARRYLDRAGSLLGKTA